MPVYKAPVEDIRFVLHDLLNIGQVAEFEGYEDATPDMYDAIIYLRAVRQANMSMDEAEKAT